MTIKLHVSVLDFPSVCEIIETASFRACSVAMDDGGRCLLDVISDPLLLQSFLESGSDDNSKDPQDGTSSESAVESPQIARYPQATLSNHITSVEHVIEPSDQMGYSYPTDSQGLLAQSAPCSVGMGLGASAALVVCSSGHTTYQHASSSRATVHHLPTSSAAPSVHQHSPVPPRPHTPLSHSIRSPSQGPPSVHSMPPPSPVQQTRSPLTSHTPSPAPAWSPAPPVLSPATSRAQSSMPSIAFQQPQNQVLQTTANVTQIVTALSQQTQKLTVQQQQQQQQPLLIHPQTSPIHSPQQQPTRLSMPSPVVTTGSVPAVTPSMVQIIPAPQANVPLPSRTSHSTVRPIQPKIPQQILPKPASTAANQFVSPVVKQTANTPVTASQRGVNVPLQSGATSQLVIGQGQPGVFSGPQSTFVLNSIIPGVGQSPILIQGNLSNLTNLSGLQLTLRPPVSAASSQTLSSSGAQNNPTLIAALQGPNQPAQALFTQTKSPLHGQQTIVIPNNIAPAGLAPQNLSLTPTAIRNNTIVPSASQGQGFLTRSNFILSQRVVGPNQGIQLQQIQTQGPIIALASGTIALPHLSAAALQNPTLGSPQLAPGAVPVHGVVTPGQGVISLQSHPQHTALQQHTTHQQQSLFSAAVPLTSHVEQPSQAVVQLPQAVPTQHITASITASQSTTVHLQQQQQPPQENPSPKPNSPPKPSKVPSVNLEELLKEHGIVPENTPPPSPDSQSPQSEDPVPTQIHTSGSIVQSPQLIAALQSQHHVVLEQLSQSTLTTSLPQMKLALAQDGSVILQPSTAFIPSTRFPHNPNQAKMSTAVNSTVPTVTTSAVCVPVVTTQPCPARNHSALLACLNSGPAISIPEVVTSLALATNLGSCTSSSISSSTITTAAPVLIPLTVQSLNSSPITSHVQSVTSASSSVSAQIPVELCSSLPQSVNHVTSSTVPAVLATQSVQSKPNHVILGLQPIITSSHQQSSAVQTVAKSTMGNITPHSSHISVIPPQNEKIKQETCVLGVVEGNNGAITSSHKLQAINPVVPNDVLHKEAEVENHVPAVSVSGQTSVVPLSVRKNHQLSTSAVDYASQSEKQPVTKSNSAQSIHLVNLLKQNSVHNPSLRAIAPVTISPVTHCETVRQRSVIQGKCGSSVVTAGTSVQQRHPVPHLPNSSCDNQQSKDAPLARPHVSSSQPSSVSTKSSVHLRGKSPVIRISSASKTALINKQLTVDQNYAVTPDTVTPFSSKRDACQRLLKYHVYNTKVPSFDEMATADQVFEKVSVQLLDKVRKMVNKYHLLQLKDSMRPCPTPECVLLERLFQEDEKDALQRDKATVSEGKFLDLPPPPPTWLKDLNSSCCSCTEACISPVKEECDQLEAPVIDSCVDVASPPNDVCDRSPPTLKRIVVKVETSSDTEIEDFHSKKRLKVQSTSVKSESNTACNSDSSRSCDKSGIPVSEDKSIPTESFTQFRDNKDDDIMTKLRKELNISPLENDDDSESVVPHVDFEPPGCANGLTDFETPVARTDGPCNTAVIAAYGSCARTNVEIKYDFDMLDCPSEWVEAYANHVPHNAAESEAAVESILSDQHNPSELDLSGIEGLGDQLDDSQQSIPNGIQDEDEESRDSEIHYIPYHISKSRVYREDLVSGHKGHNSEMQEQVQSAIKSILELQSDERSYFDGEEVDILPRLYDIDKTSHDSRKRCRVSPGTYVSLDGDVGVNSETDTALDEAVRSILQ